MNKYLFIVLLLFTFIIETSYAAEQKPAQPVVDQSVIKKSDMIPINQNVAVKPPAQAKATPVGRVVWIKGTFTATYPNQRARVLQKSSVIYLHDTLKTDTKTQAQVVFSDHSLMTFRQGTNFYIKNYAYYPEKKEGSVGSYVMNLIEGGFRTITGLIPKANSSDYEINTPVATIGVRGTDFMIFVDKNNLGSSFFSSAHGWVGERTRIKFSAIKTKKSFRLREGAAGGGG